MLENSSLPPATNAGSIDVLVVDDDDAGRSELISGLDRSHISCIPAADGWSALRLVAEGWRPGLIVTDVRMPELSGLEFAEQLGKFYPAARPKLVLISGHAGADEILAALRLGAVEFLPKPIDLRRLIQVVRTVQLELATLPVPAEKPAAARPAPGSPRDRIERILSENRMMRRLRSQYLSDDLFSEPSWEMLLQLHHAALSGTILSVTSLGGVSDIPMTTALRRIGELERAGLVVRVADGKDRRRAKIELSPHGRLAVEGFLSDYFASGRTDAAARTGK